MATREVCGYGRTEAGAAGGVGGWVGGGVCFGAEALLAKVGDKEL